MFETSHPNFFKESTKTVDSFIQYEDEKPIKKFFLKDIDGLLKNYDPGLPKMKPDVLEQMKVLEKERDEMMKQLANKQNGPIMMNVPGQQPKQLSNQDVVQLIQQQQQAIQQSNVEKQGMQNNLLSMQNQLIQASLKIQELQDELKSLKAKNESKLVKVKGHVLEDILDVLET